MVLMFINVPVNFKALHQTYRFPYFQEAFIKALKWIHIYPLS